MAGLPLFKVGVLFVRTLAKPVAKRLKDQAASHPAFRQGVIYLGNLLNTAQTHVEVRVMGHVPKAVKPLREEAAVTRGAEFLGESFIFAVAVFFVFVEFFRQQTSKAKAEQDKKRRTAEKVAAQRARDEVLERAILRMDARMARLERALWISRAGEVTEEELLKRDREVASRAGELQASLKLTRVPTLSEIAAAEEAERRAREAAEAGTASSAGTAAAQGTPARLVSLPPAPSREELLDGPSQRERALEAAWKALDAVGETFRGIGPLWTSGLRQAGQAADQGEGEGRARTCFSAKAPQAERA